MKCSVRYSCRGVFRGGMRTVFPYTIIIVLLVVIFFMSNNHKKEIVEIHSSDTMTVTTVDTIFCDRIHFVREVVKDTIYLEKDSANGLKLPLTQKYYSTDKYQAWISGYRPSLDSIRTFNKTEYKYITNTIEKRVYPKTVDWYMNVGTMVIKDNLAPNIGVEVKFRNGLTVGGSVGYFDHSAYYGINFGYKLNR